MRVAATLHACGGHLGSNGMQQKFELKNEDTTEKFKILHNSSTYQGLSINTKRRLLQTHETVPLKCSISDERPPVLGTMWKHANFPYKIFQIVHVETVLRVAECGHAWIRI